MTERGQRSNAKLLEVAPIGLVEARAGDLGYFYTSMDLSSERAEVLTDLCAIAFSDRSFEVVICFHVLEHVSSDRAAVEEIGRVLSQDGCAVVSVPWNRDSATTDEDVAAPPSERVQRFGQSDHVRMYGRDINGRLAQGGLMVEELCWRDFVSAGDFRRYALDGDDDRFWVLRRP